MRTAIVTGLPLVTLLGFAGVGVVASRSGGDEGGATSGWSGDTPVTLEFAIATPVAAKWAPVKRDESAYAFEVKPPDTRTTKSIDLERENLCLDKEYDAIYKNAELKGADFGLIVNNEQESKRVVIDGLSATECTGYGAYIFGVSDWWIRNSLLHQAKDAREHGLRVPICERLRVSDTIIDTRLAGKTAIWLMSGDSVEFRNLKILGGRCWFSIDPGNPGLGDGEVTNVTIADCWIDLNEDQAWANALEFMPGVDNVTITNLHVRSARQPIGAWKSVDGAPAAKNIRWKDIWIPAPGQAADKPFDELEWVKLRDDDWDRILVQKGRTREELVRDGVGPME